MSTDWLPAGYVGGFAGHYVEAVRAQLAEFGEWVRHRPSGGKDDWVFMHFVEPPDDLHLGGAVLEVAEVSPRLRGLISDFAAVPVKYKQYAEGHTRNGTGSLMVVRGVVYEVKDVKLNPWGEVRLPLLEISGARDPNFYADLAAFLCPGEA